MNINLKKYFFLWAGALLLSATAFAAPPSMSVKIDGDLNDAAWKYGREISAFVTEKGDATQVKTTGKILTDKTYLYLAFQNEEPLMSKLQALKLPRDGHIWTNDCIEIYVAPFADKSTFYHFIVDAEGQIYDAISIDGEEDKNYDLDITAKTQKHEDGWTLELAVPLSNLGINTKRAPLMNFARERKPVGELSAWHGWFGQPDTWQRVPLSLDENRSIDVRAWKLYGTSPQYGKDKAFISYAASQDIPSKVLLSSNRGDRKIAKNAMDAPENILWNASLLYELLPRDKPQYLQLSIDNGGLTAFSVKRRLSLPESALVAELHSSYYYAKDAYALFDIHTFLSPESIKNANLHLTVKDPKGNVTEQKIIENLRNSQQISADISQWREGMGAAFIELMDGAERISYQRVEIPKRPGPFG